LKSPLTRIRLGLIALALSGLLFVLGIVLRGGIDMADPESFIRAASSAAYVPAWTIILVGVVLNLYGTFALYRYLTYQGENMIAFLGFVLRIAGIALVIGLFTFFAVSVPAIAELYQQGNQEVIAVVEANFTSGLGLVLLAVGGSASIFGLILFAIAIWRHGRLPKWTGVALALSLPMLAFPVTFATELLGAVLLLISAGVMAWKVWQESMAGPGQ
jgi:hypothetical protein